MENDSKVKRNSRIAAISHILTGSPNRVFTLGYFCGLFGSAKSTVSEDINILRGSFQAYGLGQIETVPGASGGVKYLPFPVSGARGFIQGLCDVLSEPERALPGGYLFLSDILSAPDITDRMGALFASRFCAYEPDFVLTVETKGVSLAQSTARALGVHTVIAGRSQLRTPAGLSVSINYVGSNGRLQTMILPKKLVRPGQRALIIDDFMKKGATAQAMMDMMREFQVTVVGTGMMITRETEGKKRVEGVASLMTVREISEETGARVLPSEWID